MFFQRTIYIRLAENELSVRCLETGSSFITIPYLAIEDQGKQKIVKAIGQEAHLLRGQPKITVANPYSHPRMLVGDFLLAQKILQHAVHQTFRGAWLTPAPRAVIHPTEKLEGGMTDVERKVFHELALGAGAREVAIWTGAAPPTAQDIEETLKAAQGRARAGSQNALPPAVSWTVIAGVILLLIAGFWFSTTS